MQIKKQPSKEIYLTLGPDYDTRALCSSYDGAEGFKDFIRNEVRSFDRAKGVPDH